MGWLLARQKGRTVAAALYGSLWMVSLSLAPFLISQAIDRGLRPRDATALIAWAGVLFGMGLANAGLGIMRHRTMTKLRLAAGMRTASLVMEHATRRARSKRPLPIIDASWRR